LDNKLGRPGETLSLSVQRSIVREREPYSYTNTFAAPAGPATFDHLRLALNLVKVEVAADYVLPLPAERELKLGYSFEDDHNGFDNVGDTVDPATRAAVNNPNVTNHFRYAQQVEAVYAQYDGPLGPWRFQAGARVEDAHIAFLQITGNLPGGRHDLGVYPSLHLDRGVGESGRIAFSIGRRISRPDPEWLNPFSDHQDTHNLRAGNPNLLPKDTWSYELGYNNSSSAFGYGLTGYVRIERNAVTDVIQPVTSEVVLATRTNLPQSRSGGMELSANGKLGPKMSYTLSGNIFYTQINTSALGSAGLRSTTGADLKASMDVRPTMADTIQFSYNRTDRRLTPQGSLSAVGLVNLGYRRQLRPDLAAMITVTDVLDGQRTQRTTLSPALNDVYSRHQVGRVALVGLVYTFGVQKKAKSNGFQYDQ
jgi:outer membrane receptor protein involved in Fe transport